MIKHHMLDPARIEEYIFKPYYEAKTVYNMYVEHGGPCSIITHESQTRMNIYSDLIDALDLYNEFKEWEREQDDKSKRN